MAVTNVAELNALVERVKKAQREYASFTQEQVNESKTAKEQADAEAKAKAEQEAAALASADASGPTSNHFSSDARR